MQGLLLGSSGLAFGERQGKAGPLQVPARIRLTLSEKVLKERESQLLVAPVSSSWAL